MRYGFKGENPTSKQFQNMSVQNILNGEQRTIIVIAVTVHTEENIFSDDEANEMVETTETRKWLNQNRGKYL